MKTKTAPKIVVHVIESAISAHYESCKRSHGGNDGWFHCEAKAIGADPTIVAAHQLIGAVERWRLGMRVGNMMPSADDRKLMAAVDVYRDAIYSLTQVTT